MRLRKCTDISLANPVYFELLGGDGSTLLNIQIGTAMQVEVLFGKDVVNFDQFTQLLQDAKIKLLQSD